MLVTKYNTWGCTKGSTIYLRMLMVMGNDLNPMSRQNPQLSHSHHQLWSSLSLALEKDDILQINRWGIRPNFMHKKVSIEHYAQEGYHSRFDCSIHQSFLHLLTLQAYCWAAKERKGKKLKKNGIIIFILICQPLFERTNVYMIFQRFERSTIGQRVRK